VLNVTLKLRPCGAIQICLLLLLLLLLTSASLSATSPQEVRNKSITAVVFLEYSVLEFDHLQLFLSSPFLFSVRAMQCQSFSVLFLAFRDFFQMLFFGVFGFSLPSLFHYRCFLFRFLFVSTVLPRVANTTH